MTDEFFAGLKKTLAEIAQTRMPFGKYGPEHYPPAGIPLYDLPYPYLAYFRRRGFPAGRLGVLLQILYELKRDGADSVFAPFREQQGGRTPLRRRRPGPAEN